MATFKTNTKNTYYAVLTLSEKSQSIVNNQTTLDYKIVLYSGYNNFSGYTIGYRLTINGKQVAYHDNSGAQTSMGANSSKTVRSGTCIVTHNSDGSKKDMSVKLEIWTDNMSYLPVSLSVTNTMNLTTIPRASSISYVTPTLNAGETVGISINRKSSSFTHAVKISLGSYSKTITDVGTSTSYTIPLDWINAITTGTSAKATVTVTTYSGSTKIGSAESTTFTITVPVDIVPIVSDIVAIEAVSVVTAAFGNRFARTLSQLNVSIDASGTYGSTIKSYATAIDGVNYVGQAFNSNALNKAGTVSIKTTVKDSRGRSATLTEYINVVDYFKPTIIDMSYYPCDSDGTQNSSGTCTKVLISGKIASVEEQNTKALILKYKATAEENYTIRTVLINNYAFEVEVIIENTDPTVTYEYIAELTDKISTTKVGISTGVPVISRLAGGKGLAFFMEALEEGLTVNGLAKLIKGLDIIGSRDPAFDIRANIGGDLNTYRSHIMKGHNGTADTGTFIQDFGAGGKAGLIINNNAALSDIIKCQHKPGTGAQKNYNLYGEHNLEALVKNILDRYNKNMTLESTFTAGTNWTVNSQEAVVSGGNLRLFFNATRKTATGAGNITNEDILTYTIKDPNNVLKNIYNGDGTTASEGPLASFHTTGITRVGTDVKITVRISATHSGVTSCNSYILLMIQRGDLY